MGAPAVERARSAARLPLDNAFVHHRAAKRRALSVQAVLNQMGSRAASSPYRIGALPSGAGIAVSRPGVTFAQSGGSKRPSFVSSASRRTAVDAMRRQRSSPVGPANAAKTPGIQ